MNLRKLPTREFDPVMLVAAVGLVTYGALLIYSGSLNNWGTPSLDGLSHPVMRQAVFAVLGLVALIAASRLDYRILAPLSLSMYVVSIAMLIYVLFAGQTEYGSSRWIDVAGTQVQPSEIAKVTTVVLLAKFFADNESNMQSFRVFAVSLAIAALPAVLVLVEPDLGSAMVFGALWFAMVVIAGARTAYVLGALVAALVLAPVALWQLAHGYQLKRLEVWINPESDPTGAGFNILQAEISIGSGGLWGKGFTEGSQTQLDYLRTQTTDYVFSVGAEELGFVGAMVLFGLFILLLFRFVRVAGLADDAFGRLIAVGIAAFILFQVFVNIAVNIRLLPVTGVPLPLVSAGGSSLVTILAAIGILQSILGHRRRRGRG
jgi:rod shape determining protein RodA